ncbi:MAG TPA: MG2 domain-containing protein [Planctomycetota bacterium]|jgi:hypothetical protein
MKYLFAIAAFCLAGLSVLAEDAAITEVRVKAQAAMKANNWKDAYGGFSKIALDPKDDANMVGEDLTKACQCLQNLGRHEEVDDFRDKVIALQSGNWRLLLAAAKSIAYDQHYGFVVAGKFCRGGHRGGGQYVTSTERDRIRALQLMAQAMDLLKTEPDKNAAADFYTELAAMISLRNGRETWRLQYASDLKALPDYQEGYHYYNGETRGAPVDASGQPIYYKVPKDFATAQNDGERWRWALAMVAELAPDRTASVRLQFANFLQQQFDVRTMSGSGFGGGRRGMQAPAAAGAKDAAASGEEDESGPYAVQTLGEDETIARLATGIKRFKLPDEFNFIKIYRGIADEFKANNTIVPQALGSLTQTFEDRQQYVKAAEILRRSIADYGDQKSQKQNRLDQIVGNWGVFEATGSQVAGQKASLEYRFRNGKKVSFTAQEIDVVKLLADIRAYLKTNPARLDWAKINIDNIGYKLVQENQAQYLGKETAQWDLELKPRDKHFDRRITITTPLEKAGAYLLSAKMDSGNISRVVLWLSDTAMLSKSLEKEALYYIADATTGQPVAGANVEFMGYEVRWDNNRQNIQTAEFSTVSDADGFAHATADKINRNWQWLAVASTKEGRRAFLGFSNVWFNNYNLEEYNVAKPLIITDRPVYRPNQPVKFKCWVAQAKYDQEGKSGFAGAKFSLEIHNPKGDKIFDKQFTADEFGGFDGEITLDKEATLGAYNIQIPGYWPGGSFRLEEYKKPEFEVKVDAPVEPVMLGEKITATVNAKYYFGAPVVDAKVKYKVMRSSYTANWYPTGQWDWFYQPGYWWFASDYAWYPGWREWGCRRPSPWWWGGRQDRPEMVMENEVAIGADGTVKVEIDTAVAKAMHGDTDHKYELTAEITDSSRRTIVGAGNVMAARTPFKVYSWVDRGYYRAGDTVRADFSAQTLDNKPVQGKGQLRLLKVTYDKDKQPVEKLVQEWALETNAEGKAQQQIKAADAGQYRLSYKVSDTKNHTQEGGYIFSVMGQGQDAPDFRFNNIELVADQREYKPGDKARVMVSTDRAGSVVLLFARPSNGVYLPPKMLRIQGKATIEELDIGKRDMPNFFVEAITISDGKVHTETREIIVPPENKVLDVSVVPSSKEYKPGQKAKVQLKLTEPNGEPFSGSTVVTVYDKAVEYISGGSNVPEIKSHFWKWRRHHYGNTVNNLSKFSQNIQKQGEPSMGYLGAFGYLVAQLDEGEGGDPSGGQTGGFGGGRGGGRRELQYLRKDAAPGAPPAPMAANALGAADGQLAEGKGMAMEKAATAKQSDKAGAGPGGDSGQMVEPTVRSNFADSAFWIAKLNTGADGKAEIEVPMPENLTTWKIKVWAMGNATRVGQGEAEVLTTKNLLVRLQAPRFFTEKDEVVLSANVHNYLKTKKSVKVSLECSGGVLDIKDAAAPRTIEVDPNADKRVDWPVLVTGEGLASVRVKALTDEESDAMEMKFPAQVHGMMKTQSFAGAMRPEKNNATLAFSVPEKRRMAESRLEIRYSPTLAGALVDALPYLAEYPYGCTEQTLNRFLPTVITQKVLNRMNVNLKDIQQKITNLNAQEIGDDVKRAQQGPGMLPAATGPGCPPGTKPRNPVFDENEVANMARAGVDRLAGMQCGDGGWGWFSGWGEYSFPHTTAYVVHGLQIAKADGIAVPPNSLERGIAWLKNYQDKQTAMLRNAAGKINPYKERADNLDAFVYMVMTDSKQKDQVMEDFLYRDRGNLAVYGKAMLGLALLRQGQKEKLDMVIQNIDQFLVQDDENQTAYLKLPEDNHWWYWYGSEYEAQAYYLKLLAATDAKSEKASRLAKYLINNRRNATYWNSTRDTAICVEALAEYLTASGEDGPDMKLEVIVDGKKAKEVAINQSNLFTYDNKLVLSGKDITSGAHNVEFRKTGRGPLYFNAYMSNFTLEDHITKTGLEVKVDRKYYKLTRVDKSDKVQGAQGQALDQKVEKYERKELQNLAALKSGDLVEIELEVDSKNDYEYIVMEDMKAAGFEPADVRSGYNNNSLGAYMELRDERVCFFVRQLMRGKHSLSYRMRAEIPGKFSALPTKISAMYAPELRGNADEIKLQIAD